MRGSLCIITLVALAGACAVERTGREGLEVDRTAQALSCALPPDLWVNPQTAQAQLCFGLNLLCPSGYACGYVADCQQFYCRRTSADRCLLGGSPVQVNGGPWLCSLTAPMCPAGSSCQPLLGTTRSVCCGPAAGSTAACAAPGMVPYQSGGQPLACLPGLSTCPAGYSCQLAGSGLRFNCCGSPPPPASLLCASGATAAIDPTGRPQVCTPGAAGACPAGYACAASSASGTSLCCALPPPSPPCADGSAPYVLDGHVVACQPAAGGGCPAGYSCVQGAGSGYRCCAVPPPPPPPPSCADGASPYLDPATEQPQVCAPGAAGACPSGYACAVSSAPGTSLCCALPPAPSSCADGSAPYAANGQVVACQPAIEASCPTGYSCVTGPGQRYQCCATASAPASYCAPGSTPYLSPATGQPQGCTPGTVGACPVGFACQYATPLNAYYCCGGPAAG